MRLTQLYFEENQGQSSAWTVGLVQLADGMLLVGKNAVGKSRTLAVIRFLADILRSKQGVSVPATWRVTFTDNNDIIDYQLSCGLNTVLTERLSINGQVKLTREADGRGEIELHDGKQRLKFQVPNDAVAVVAKRDLYQHDYLEPLHRWAASLRYYPFGSDMGRARFAIFAKGQPLADPTAFEQWLGIFSRGEREHGTAFKAKVIEYMGRLSYSIEDIRIEPAQVEIIGTERQLPGPLHWIAVKERELSCWTNQLIMSQGMFRALALMIQLAYAELSSRSDCILLDDVGEGLDFERSAAMIQLLLDLVNRHKMQVLMTTNDRFVMNAVPLEHWGIIRRQAGHCDILTYQNSRAMFEEFRLTGLSNFDLLRSGFFEDAPALN